MDRSGAGGLDQRIARRLRTLRLRSGRTQAELARAAGVSFQQLQKYEQGATPIASSRLYRLAHALGVPVAVFFAGEDAPPAELPETPGGLGPEAAALARHFARIADPALRRALKDLFDGCAGNRLSEP